MYPLPKEDKQVSPYFVFYLIHSMQVGVGILGFERIIAQSAGQNAWIAVIIAGIIMIGLVFLSYRILNRGKNDIVAIHHDVFGKWIGGMFSLYFILYYAILVLVILRTYVEVIQVWVFPDVGAWVFLLIILLIAYYYVIGGFRVVTGISFLGVIYGLPLLLVMYFPLKNGHLGNLLPLFDVTFRELYEATKGMTLNFLGFEVLFMFYPFIKKAPKSEKWAYFAVIFSTFIYLVTLLVTFVYFSQEQLKTTIWATLSLWKIVDLTIIERFEYVGICIWFFVILPNICIGLWCASRGMHRLFSIRQKTSLRFICLLVLLSALFFRDRQLVDTLNDIVSQIGLYTIYFYIPFLYVVQMIMKRWKKT
jgi:spore germination protein (amino acid permease)